MAQSWPYAVDSSEYIEQARRLAGYVKFCVVEEMVRTDRFKLSKWGYSDIYQLELNIDQEKKTRAARA